MSDRIIERDVEELRHTIYGNGDDGLKTKVDRHEQSLKAMKKLGWIIIGSSIGTLFTLWIAILGYIFIPNQIHPIKPTIVIDSKDYSIETVKRN